MSEIKFNELSRTHQKELLQYHTTLKQFLSMSVAAKTNPTRAVKAREKLLKLSPSQFFELSTDVYDELTRRIDESTNEPDFLLPKSTFHPRRNEAREKLGSLQATRFRDLASDILYEIERRKYHLFIDPKSPSLEKDLRNSMSPSSKKRSSKSFALTDISDHSKDVIVALQSATVIPKKADMDWGSDEEDDEIARDRSPKQSTLKSPLKTGNRQSYDTHQTSGTSIVSSPKSPTRSVTRSPQHRTKASFGSIDEVNNGGLQHGFKDLKSNSPPVSVTRGLSVGKGRNKDREIELLLDEGTKMDKIITELEQKNTLLQTKSDKFEQEAQELKKLNETLNSKIQKLERDVYEKQESLSNSLRAQKRNEDALIEAKNEKSLTEEASIDGLKREVVEWKSRFEGLKFKKMEDLFTLDKISEENIISFVAADGIVPVDLLSKLRTSVHKFLLDLNRSKRSQKVDLDELFSNISKVAKISSQVAALSPLNEKAELIRAAISHAITTARYFAVYPELLPKLTIESAVSEITFAVFEFVSELKLIKDNSIVPDSPAPISDRNFGESVEEVSPVKPLRMGKKPQYGSLSQDESQPTSPEGTHSLPLAINSQMANDVDQIGKKPFNLGTRDSPLNKTSQTSTPMKTGFPSVVSRFSPDVSERETPINGLRKSSSSNFLSKVKQFEHQADSTRTSPNSKKPVVSQLQSSIVDKFGGRKPSGGVEIFQDFKPRNLSKELNQVHVEKDTSQADTSITSNRSSPVQETIGSPKDTSQRSLQNYVKSESNEPVSTNSPTHVEVNDKRESVSNSPVFLKSSKEVHLDSLEVTENQQIEPAETRDSTNNEKDDSFSAFDLKNEISENNNISKQYSPTTLKRQASLNKSWNVSPTVVSSTTASSRTTAAISTASGLTADLESEDSNTGNLDQAPKIRQSLTAAFTESTLPIKTHEVEERAQDQTTSNSEEVEVMYGSTKNTFPSKINNDVVNHEPSAIDDSNQSTHRSPTSSRTISAVEKKDGMLHHDNQSLQNGTSSFRGDSSLANEDKYDISDEIKPQTLEVEVSGLIPQRDISHEQSSEDEDDEEQDEHDRPFNKDRSEEEFDVRDFDIEDPDNTLSELLLYLEHQTVKVISTIQTLLTSIKATESTKGELRSGALAIDSVVSQMVEATSISMNQSRNAPLKDHGAWVVTSLTDAGTRMMNLCSKDIDSEAEDDDSEYADKHFKQRLAGIAFDVAKSTKELVKSVEEANLKEEIEQLNARLIR